MAQDQRPVTAGLSMEALEALLIRVGQHSATAMRQSLQRENPDYDEISVFNPLGIKSGTKAKLRRTTLFCGMRQNEDQLTPDEVDLFNRFESDKEAREGAWTASVARNGSREVLMINVPAKGLDQLMSLPNGLALILRELLDGKDAADANFLVKEVEKLRARVEELESTQVR